MTVDEIIAEVGDHAINPNVDEWWSFSAVAMLVAEIERLRGEAEWRPIETAPHDGTYILLAGPSGYRTTPLRVEVGHWDEKYRPLNPWQTFSNDAFTDGGEPATHWRPLATATKGEDR